MQKIRKIRGDVRIFIKVYIILSVLIELKEFVVVLEEFIKYICIVIIICILFIVNDFIFIITY